MAIPKGEMKITILPDGRITVQTGDMAGPVHQSADSFMEELKRLMGGEVEEVKLDKGHHHEHGGAHHRH